MESAPLILSPNDSAEVRRLAQRLGKTEAELLHEAVAELLQRASLENWKMALHQAKGMWADHPNAPDVRELRTGWQERNQQFTGPDNE